MIFDEDIYESITMQTSTSGFKPKRGQANRRERVRTENVNAGFDKLRKLIPTEPEDRKLSKIEILRLATSYIKHLYNLTRANSCLEADELDRRGGRNKSKQQGVVARATEGEPAESQAVVGLKSKRPSGLHHVCTFCLMISKQQQHGMLKSASKQQAARQ